MAQISRQTAQVLERAPGGEQPAPELRESAIRLGEHARRRPLKNEELIGERRELRNELDGAGAGAEDGVALTAKSTS